MTKVFEPADQLGPPEIKLDDELGQGRLFLDAMADVRPLSVRKTAPRKNGIKHKGTFPQESDNARRLLSDVVEGRAEFEWWYHPGYREGGPEGRNRPLIKKLRRGAFSVQAELDLHGLTQREALFELEAFFKRCGQRNLRCVRIIHGKGNNSTNQEGVLRQKIPQWLSTRRFSRLIVAFTSARPSDGGLGATYVLLRNTPHKRR
jgi:DNA-nicking Smr family endonuclease